MSTEYVLPTDELKMNNKIIEGRLWEVYSDRVYNRTFNFPKGSIKSTLEYLHRYYVIEKDKEFLHIIKDNYLLPKGILSDSAVDLGWINKKDLLLWKHCIVSSKSKLNKKILLAGKTLSSLTHTNSKTNSLNIYYIFKEENSRVLLGKIPRISGTYQNIKSFIIGWAPESSVFYWTNNMAVEANLDPVASSERKEKKIICKIFKNKSSAKKVYKKGKINCSNYLWMEKINNENINSNNKIKFPVKKIDNNIAEVVYLNNYKHFEEGYCSFTSNKLNKNLFNLLILVPRIKLSALIDYYDKLSIAINKKNARNDLINTITNFSSANAYYSPSDSIIYNYSINKINKLIWGGYNLNSKIGKIHLKDFKNPIIISDSTLKIINREIDKNLNKLIKTYNSNNYENSFLQNGIFYYWIPMEYFL